MKLFSVYANPVLRVMRLSYNKIIAIYNCHCSLQMNIFIPFLDIIYAIQGYPQRMRIENEQYKVVKILLKDSF